jgi:hypothetical protein
LWKNCENEGAFFDERSGLRWIVGDREGKYNGKRAKRISRIPNTYKQLSQRRVRFPSSPLFLPAGVGILKKTR